MEAFDLIVVGGGTGGYTAAVRASQLGLKAALVERDKIGGVCLHRGCIPTKVLLQAAYNLSLIRRSNTFGISADNISLDYGALTERREQVVGGLHKNIRSVVEKKVKIIEGDGKLVSPTEVSVNGDRIQAKNIVIATGSRPKGLPGLEPDGDRVLTSDHCLELTEVPKSIIVVGAGAVGLEFASFYLDMGAEVTVVEALPNLLPLEDADIGKGIARILEGRGATILTGAKVRGEDTRTFDNMIELTVEQDGEEKKAKAERVLVAVGREGLTDGLGLENTNVKLDRGCVLVDETYRTDEPSIYAIGDVIGGLQLVHVAGAEGHLAADAISGKEVEQLDYTRVPRVTYTRPHAAGVGLTEQEAKEHGHNVKATRFSYRGNAMAQIHDEVEGFIKLVYDVESGDILGIHILGYDAGELISEAALARFLNTSTWELGTNVHPHPSLSELFGDVAQLSAGLSIYS